ncbi:MAG: SIR2 family protein [Ignavibacteriae bacterium]|nr:SIR2 family protein [Ignavibacteriota bacterium]
MRKAIVLGAGFSKAIGCLPITCEMFNSFRKTLNIETIKQHRNRIKWGESIFEFLTRLEDRFAKQPLSRANDKSAIIESNYEENFEAVLSMIDLGIQYELKARTSDGVMTSNLDGKPLLWDYSTSQLKQLRYEISTYLYLTLIDPRINQNLLDSFYEKMVNKDTHFITFNYDLIVEQFLYKKELWKPKDGYGLEFDEFPQVKAENKKSSSHLVLKMHGSLNWRESELENRYKIENMLDDGSPIFPDYFKNEIKRNFEYEGGINLKALKLPSLVKKFNSFQLLSIWRKAHSVISKSEEVIFIGYSFPEADTSVYTLFNTIDFSSKKIAIIDPKPDEIEKRVRKITLCNNIHVVNKSLEEYL